MVDIKYKIGVILTLVIMFLGALSLYFFWNPSYYNFFPKCPLYSFTGIYCPGCGSQRAIHQIINGNIIEGIRYNYMLVLLFIVLAYKATHYIITKLYNKPFNNILHRPATSKLILVLVILFWVLRNIKLFPFTELAP